ncbi:MAG TPA: hypothetical protein VJB06_02695 [archaeon]|nr:hypothetical protein [archaeon]
MVDFKYSLIVPPENRQRTRNLLYANNKLKSRLTISDAPNGLDVSVIGDEEEGPDFYKGVILATLGVNGDGSAIKLTSYSKDHRLEQLEAENRALVKQAEELRIILGQEKGVTNRLLARLDELDENAAIKMREDPTYGILEYLKNQAPKIIPVYTTIEQMAADPAVGSGLKRIKELSEAALIDAVTGLGLPLDILDFLKFDSDVDRLLSGNPDMEPDDFRDLRKSVERSQALLGFIDRYIKSDRSENPVLDDAFCGIINREQEQATLDRFTRQNTERTSAIERVREMSERHAKIKKHMEKVGNPPPVEYVAIVRPADQGIVLQVSTPCGKEGFVRNALLSHIETAGELDGIKTLDETLPGPEDILTRRFLCQSVDLGIAASRRLTENYKTQDPFTLGLKLLMHSYTLLE